MGKIMLKSYIEMEAVDRRVKILEINLAPSLFSLLLPALHNDFS